MVASTSRHVVIVGGSYAGLCTAAAFKANGWNTTVIERSSNPLRSGGGVVVQRRMADYLESHGLASPGITSVPARLRILFQPDGTQLQLPETARSYTAWDVLLREFEQTVGETNIRRGTGVTEVEFSSDFVTAVLEDGGRVSGDLLVAADGVGSPLRSQFLPGHEPTYAGYVAWRGTVDKSDLPSRIRRDCTDTFCTFTGDHTNIVAYEIPGPDGSVEPGARRVNWVWYVNVDRGKDLDCLLVGNTGKRKKSTLQRGEARPETIHAMLSDAEATLPARFAAIVGATPEPFVQAIQDFQAPRLVFDRAVLIGDAACLIRPHLGAGTGKAVEDAVSLADAVCGSNAGEGCLQAWEIVRLEAHDAMAEQAKAVARRSGLGFGNEETVASGSRSA